MDLFFELIQIYSSSRTELSRIPNDEEWKSLYKLAYAHTLIGVLFSSVMRLPKEQQPCRALLMQWYASTIRIKKQNQILNLDSTEIIRLLKKDGFFSVLLKGQGIALSYPEPDLRMSGDIDLWVYGDKKYIIHYLQKNYNYGLKISFHHAAFIFKGRTRVEVHFTPSLMRYYKSCIRLQKFFSQQKEIQIDNRVLLPYTNEKISVPNAYFNAIFLLVHIFRHLIGEGIGLRQLMDFYYCLKGGFEEDIKLKIIQVYRDLKLLEFAKAIMYVEQVVFGLEEKFFIVPPNIESGKVVLAEIVRGGNFCRYEETCIVKNETHFQRGLRLFCSNMKLMRYYPYEVVSNPFYSLFHLIWRKWYGYL